MNPRDERASAPRAKTSAEVFERAFRHGPTMQSIVRLPEGVIVDINESFTQVTGYGREEVIGKTPFDLDFWVSPEKIPVYREQLLARGRMRNFEVDLRTKDGRVRTILLNSEIVDIDGTPHTLNSGIDITSRKEAEAELRATAERLRQSEERFSKAFRANPAIVALTRFGDGTFVGVNEAFLRVLGYAESDVLGRTAAEVNLHAAPELRERFMRGIVEQGFVRDCEFIVRTKAGGLRNLLVSGERTDIDGTPHLLTVGLDITERKRVEAELQRALVKEKELNQLKSDFVSLVSHEFRTPLEIIMSSVDNLDRYHERLPAEKRQQLLRTINKAVRRMAGMMEEVLLLGRFDSGGTEFKPAPLDLAALCHRVRDEMESATQRRCPIALTVDADASGGRGDEAVLRHILTNLLSNAVKYSEAGQPVEVAVRREGTIAEIRIADHGCGIPLADQARLFQAFHRGANVRQIHGTGLGLLIVRRCVDLHGGVVTFESVEGRGTTFTVRLPLFPPARAKPKRATGKTAKPRARKP